MKLEPKAGSRKRGVSQVAVLVSGLLLLSACSSGATTVAGEAPDTDASAAVAGPTGQIIIANGEPITGAYYDPHAAFGLVDAQLSSLVFDTLLMMDETGTVQPNVAESYEQTSDTEMTLTIRSGIKFHDGSDLTADDVVASINRLFDPESTLAQTLLAAPGEAVADGNVVTITTVKPFGPLENSLAVIPIVSAEDVANPDNWNERPNGSGPYVFVSNDGTDIVVEANADYWGESPGIQTVILRYIEDAQARQSALLSGQVDVSTRVGPDEVAGAEGNSDISIVSNAGPPAQIVSIWQHNGALGDVRVRQALAYAIDREAIGSSIMRSQNAVGFNSVPTMIPGYKDAANKFSFDPEKARELLASAGYNDDLTLTMSTSSLVPKQREIDQAIVAYLNDVGITVDVTQLEVGEFRTTYGDYDVTLNTLASFNNDPSFLLGFYTGGIGQAVFKVDEPDYGPLFEKQRETVGDARMARINEASTWVWDNAITGFLSDENWVFLVNNRVENYVRAPLVGEPLLVRATVK
jgi:peptide/nickel transport system substrate-binding protein